MAMFFTILSKIALVVGILFLLSWMIYFFNLDMKLSSKMQPIIDKQYNRHKRRPLP